MFVEIDNFMPIFLDLDGNATLADLVLEYAILRQKHGNPEEQSCHLEKDTESKKQKLQSLERSYENTREFYNQSTVDYLIELVNEHRLTIKELEEGLRDKFTFLQYLHHVSENEFFNELIHLKSRIEILQPIDYYVDNPEELLEIMK
jgi:hypothetical protein